MREPPLTVNTICNLQGRHGPDEPRRTENAIIVKEVFFPRLNAMQSSFHSQRNAMKRWRLMAFVCIA